jgi:hypothetical protein
LDRVLKAIAVLPGVPAYRFGTWYTWYVVNLIQADIQQG